jgi:hypothetical protein
MAAAPESSGASVFDRNIITRLILPLAPASVMLQTRGSGAITPELLGALALVLALRIFADQPFKGYLVPFAFSGVPIIEGTLLCSGVSMVAGDRLTFGYATYGLAAIGTLLAVIADYRARR